MKTEDLPIFLKLLKVFNFGFASPMPHTRHHENSNNNVGTLKLIHNYENIEIHGGKNKTKYAELHNCNLSDSNNAR